MTDAQTEARAIARSWTGSLVEIEEAIATVLAAKDAELAVANARAERQWAGWVKEAALRKATEAQLAEANKALEELVQIAGTLSGYFIRFPAPIPDSEFVNVCNGDLRTLWEFLENIGRNPIQERADFATRRAREAQGGENGE